MDLRRQFIRKLLFIICPGKSNLMYQWFQCKIPNIHLSAAFYSSKKLMMMMMMSNRAKYSLSTRSCYSMIMLKGFYLWFNLLFHIRAHSASGFQWLKLFSGVIVPVSCQYYFLVTEALEDVRFVEFLPFTRSQYWSSCMHIVFALTSLFVHDRVRM